MNFVKGQKVECIDNNGNGSVQSKLKIGDVYTCEGVSVDFDGIILKEFYNTWFKKCRFKTIIQTIDDVIVGMKLTHDYRGEVKIVSCDTKANTITGYEIGYKYKGTTWYTKHIENFKEYKPKEKKNMQKEETKYEVVKPFTILGIWNAFEKERSYPEFQREFGYLLSERVDTGYLIKDMLSLKSSKTLMNNLHHLEEKGFIKKIEEDVVLKPGIRLKTTSGKIFTVIDTQNLNKEYVLVGDKYLFCVGNSEILRFKGSLSNLNKKLSYYNIPGLVVADE